MYIMKSEDYKRTENTILKALDQDTDWSYAADKFLQWLADGNFQQESFNDFAEYLHVKMSPEQIENGTEVWDFFFGYGDDFEKFANDWVCEEEREAYLSYAKEF